MNLAASTAQGGEQSGLVWLVILGGIVAMALALYGLDRWDKRRNGGKNGTFVTHAGGAMLELQSLLEPSKRHVIEVKKEKRQQPPGAGDDDDTSGRSQP